MKSRWENLLMWFIIVGMLVGVLTASVTTKIGLLLMIIYALVMVFIVFPKSRENYRRQMEDDDLDSIEELSRAIDEIRETRDRNVEEFTSMYAKGEIDKAEMNETIKKLNEGFEEDRMEIEAKARKIDQEHSDSQI